MLALHEKGGAAQAILEERVLYFQQVHRGHTHALGGDKLHGFVDALIDGLIDWL